MAKILFICTLKTKIGQDMKTHGHNFLKCSCGKEHCRVCSKKIENICTQCGLSQEYLTTHCYGRILTKKKYEGIKNGTLNFTEEGWVNINKDGIPQKQHSENNVLGIPACDGDGLTPQGYGYYKKFAGTAPEFKGSQPYDVKPPSESYPRSLRKRIRTKKFAGTAPNQLELSNIKKHLNTKRKPRKA